MPDMNDLAERLLERGIVMVNGKLDQPAIDRATASLLALDARNPERGYAEVHLGSVVGPVAAGLALHDVIAQVAIEVHVIGGGLLDTSGALVLHAGTPGHRLLLPNASIHLRRPDEPSIADLSIESAAQEVTYLRERAESVLGTPLHPPRVLNAEEAVAAGLADGMATSPNRK
jgi:ATP-dependent protease ClpP protease subunit